MTEHDVLVQLAARWLRRKHALVVTELTSGSLEAADALGVANGRYTTLVECKASRADFLADAKKVFRREPERGMGGYRYYLCPQGLIGIDELPAGWGLLYAKGGRVQVVLGAEYQAKDAESEIDTLLSAIRRIAQQPIEGVSVKFYTFQTKNRASMYLRE